MIKPCFDLIFPIPSAFSRSYSSLPTSDAPENVAEEMAARLLADSTVMVLGGAGLVGTAIARRLALLKTQWRPRRIIVASQFEEQARKTVSQLENEQQERLGYIPHFREMDFVAEWGDVFVRSEFAHEPRAKLLHDQTSRRALLADLYDDLDASYERSHLVGVLRKHRPGILIDCVNTATGLSYQNVFDTAFRVRQSLLPVKNVENDLSAEVERMLLVQSVPTLVRHIQILSRVAEDIGLEQYMKIGTTGTGGMGLNLPFTHSEAKPSNLILAKSEAAFGHSGLLFLWSQTPGAPVVSEIKPGAAIGFRNVGVHSVADRYGNEFIRKPRLVQLQISNGSADSFHSLDVRENECDYPKLDKMITVAVDCGENGLFTADEFRTLSTPGSMELISPEEIAEVCVQELLGIGTGRNVLASIRGAVLGPGYRAGTVRSAADRLLTELDLSNETTMPSIALGRLGPPLLSKILFEAHILKLQFGGADGLVELAECNPVKLARELSAKVQNAANRDPASDFGNRTLSSLSYIAPTIGVPVLLEGNLMLRGPNITLPEPVGHDSKFTFATQETVDGYAQSGWVDLRASNLQVWKERARHILAEPTVSARDTTALTGLHYDCGSREINAAALASWIIAGEVHGQRDLNTVSELDED